jgi:protein tyrosine phosphatase
MEYPVVEGPAKGRDISYKYLIQYPELAELERGIPYKQFYYHSQVRNKETEYRILKKITESREHAEMLVTNCPLTTGLNRYPDVLPYKDTMVPVLGYQYINACFIDSTLSNTQHLFIATQAPLKSSMDSFWSMIWQHCVELIVMICCVTENGMAKCEEYFPEDDSLLCSDFEITLEHRFNEFPNLVHRVFRLTHLESGENKRVTHLHGNAWPDAGAPKIRDEFHTIRQIIETIKGKKLLNPNCKVAVHCSAGIGRTGLLIGIFNMVVALEEMIESDIQTQEKNARVSVFGTVRRLREQRWGMVRNFKQYKFMYKFMEYWITAYLASQANIV